MSDIILRVYNKNANVYIKVGLDEFILKIEDELERVQSNLYNLKNFQNVAQFSKPIADGEDPKDILDSRKQFNYVCHRTTLLLTALLLSIEQLKNEQNPNVKSYTTTVQVPAQMSYQTLDHKVFRSMKVWLQSPVFLD